MKDIIRLLPDPVANQIAAGEVIQRPASAVKELMENALDAGATQVQLIIRDAGKSMIQVTDNGSGMSETDARMCFERHATSKITSAEDLFAIRSMGFRGEALASIAAVAQVELKSRRPEAETGTLIEIEGSAVVRQEPCACQPGTSIIAKNLFFNIPARRNFLKSNASETRHIVEEFQRIAIARPDVAFSMHHDGFEVFRLKPGNLKQRLVGLFGANYDERIVPVNEETTILNLSGFILKPEFSKKTRGEQYFFVNNRFIKNGYLHHAVSDAFENLMPHGAFASYFLFMEIDPARIDINIHPTKTEVKFEDEKSIYAILRAAAKRSLGKFSITPSLDFDQETSFNIPVRMYNEVPKLPVINVNPGYNPFKDQQGPPVKPRTDGWEKMYEAALRRDMGGNAPALLPETPATPVCRVIGQLNNSLIVALLNSELILIDQQAAHERIIYERNSERLTHQPQVSQQELFPQTMQFTHADFVLMQELQDDIRKLGFDIREFGANTFVLNGIPSGIEKGKEKDLIEGILESYKNFNAHLRNQARENLLRSVAYNLSVKPGKPLEQREMQQIADDLISCRQPGLSPAGKPTFITITTQEIEKKFQQRQ